MYEANSTEFKPAEGDLPDTLNRFNLEELKRQIRHYSDSVGDSINIMLNIASLLSVTAIFMVLFTSEKEKEEQQKDLEKKSKHVNLAVTSIDRTDIEETIAAIDLAYTANTQATEYVKLNPKMDNKERRLKKLVPQVDVIDPDEGSS